MSTVLLDSHVVHWWAADPGRLSPGSATAIGDARELAVAGVTWFELAWLVTNGRLQSRIPLRGWLDQLAREIRTLPLTTAVAARAAALPATFPRDPADRVIFATAQETGYRLVTRDLRMREHDVARDIVIW